MSTNYNPELDTLEFKIEAALKYFLITCGFLEAQIFTGETTELRLLATGAIICECRGGPEMCPGTNSFVEDVQVCVISNVDESNSGADPFPPHRRLVKRVLYHLWETKRNPDNLSEFLHSFLSVQVPYLTVLREIEFEGKEEVLRDRKMETTLRFKMAANENPCFADVSNDLICGLTIIGTLLPEDVAFAALFGALDPGPPP